MRQRINKILLKKHPWFQKAIKGIWVLLLCFVVGLPLYVYAVRVDLVWPVWRYAKPESN